MRKEPGNFARDVNNREVRNFAMAAEYEVSSSRVDCFSCGLSSLNPSLGTSSVDCSPAEVNTQSQS